MPVLLVRHGWAGPHSPTRLADVGRNLTEKGHRQAAALVPVLTKLLPTSGVHAVSSPYRRCIETIAPTCDALGISPTTNDVLGEHTLDESLPLVASLAGSNALVATHRDVIAAILRDLAKQGVPLGRAPLAQRASVWVLDGNPFARARYIPPPVA